MEPTLCMTLSEDEIEKVVRSKLKITYVGHSLGGMLLSMYVIFSKLLKREHYLSKAILLSPCGTHFHGNWCIELFGKTCVYVVPWVAKGIAIPDCLMMTVSKLISELKNLPACNDLITYLGSQVFGGASTGK